MRIALVHDHLCGMGGSERIFQYLCEEFAEADVYTLAYNPETTLPFFSLRPPKTTWLNRFVQSAESFRWAFPLAAHVMRRVDLSDYDLVLSSSATTAKYVKAAPGKHLCYCYIPTRALWHFEEYFGKSWKRHTLKPFLSYLKKNDFSVAQTIRHFFAISESSKRYIQMYYQREAEIIHCPIETTKFKPSSQKQDHYLLVSRLEPWKKVGYAVEAFNRLGKPLKVIGTGSEGAKLRAQAKPNISFLGAVSDAELAEEYGKAKAVIFTPFLEYGLIPLEANAAGTPVLCYGRGGVEETMIPVGKPSPTALFFYEQTPEALVEAVLRFEQISFDETTLVAHASQWNIDSFKKKMRSAVSSFL